MVVHSVLSEWVHVAVAPDGSGTQEGGLSWRKLSRLSLQCGKAGRESDRS